MKFNITIRPIIKNIFCAVLVIMSGISFAQPANNPRLRGMMVPTFLDESGLKTLANWGANHVRWQLTWDGFPNSPADTATASEYRAWLEKALQHVDKMLPLCSELGIKVLIDLHTLPGGRMPDYNHRMFTDKMWQDEFITIWKDIAQRYKDNAAVWGYDLANEPQDGVVVNGAMDWPTLVANAAFQIRGIDKKHTIVVEAKGGDIHPLERFKPLDAQGVVYSFHMYVPHSFTHQRIYSAGKVVNYPGRVGLRWWDKEQLRTALRGIREWQVNNNAEIYVGEFSAIRWAPGESACQYLSDCIDLFEEFGWSWDYHAFREFHGWSVEHDGDAQNANSVQGTNCRQTLLINWFAKNKKP